MKFLIDPDLALLDQVFQRIADWTTQEWGKSCFWLSNLCMWLMLICALGDLYFFVKDIKGTIGYVILSVVALGAIRFGEKKDAEKEKMIQSRVMNSRRNKLYYRFVRIAMLSFAISNWISFALVELGWEQRGSNLWRALYFSFLVMSFYFDSCTPKPPNPLKASNRLAAQALPAR